MREWVSVMARSHRVLALALALASGFTWDICIVYDSIHTALALVLVAVLTLQSEWVMYLF